MPALDPHVWEALIRFHGHACPGLAIGARMALGAAQRLGLDASRLTGGGAVPYVPYARDEELVCVAETDACGVDAVQFLLGCTLGKGNLLLRPRGKSAVTVFYRPTERAVRLVWTSTFSAPGNKDEARAARLAHFLGAPEGELFRAAEAPFAPPRDALISASLPCAACGELTAEHMMRLCGGKTYCLDCFDDPSRIL